jgi:hypothetical protein
VVRQTLLIFGRVGGVAGELMTGNDRALSGIIAALLARGCCGDRIRGTDRFPELRQACNAAELHLEEEKSAGTPPARCEMAAELKRVESPLDQHGHWANWSSKALLKGSLHRTGRS